VSAPASVTDVVGRLEAILHPLAKTDGLACFARLYLSVTEGVRARLAGATFADPAFLAALDVRFADLFFSALERPPVPRAWAPLLDGRARRGIAPLQFALAGMNAHINRDLPVALVTTFEEAGLTLEEASPQHADYLRVNTVLASVEAEVKQQFLGGWLRKLDRVVHRFDRIDDVVAMWDVSRARDAAWTNAEALWSLRGQRDVYDAYLTTLDRSVGFAGRGLLVPADTWLARAGRRLGL
jgi:Family of unknown function (DUF5995)